MIKLETSFDTVVVKYIYFKHQNDNSSLKTSSSAIW